MIRLRLGAFLLFLGSCTASVAHLGDDAGQVASAIDAAWRDHIAAAQRKDLAGTCAIYADDVHYAVAGEPDLHGKPAIEAMERRSLQSTEVVSAAHCCLALHVDGAVAHELGTVHGEVAAAGAPAKEVRFHYAAMWARGEGGVWRIARMFGHVAAAP